MAGAATGSGGGEGVRGGRRGGGERGERGTSDSRCRFTEANRKDVKDIKYVTG